MNLIFIAYSRQGCAIAQRLMGNFPEESCQGYTIARLAKPPFRMLGRSSEACYKTLFQQADVLVFIGACGIAVRAIAPYIKDKCTDPAVLCIDDTGRFVIPLLSGHIGGANAMATTLAKCLGATPVITTATDRNHKFSVDAWAASHGFLIDSMSCAKAVSAAILEHPVPLLCEFPVTTAYPNGTFPGTQGEIGILISYRERRPFRQTLRLVPKILHLGIGCRKGTTEQAIRHAVQSVCRQHAIDLRAIRCAASIDIKQEEEGLLQYCRTQNWNLSFYSAEELLRIPGEYTSSAFVKKITGVENVCERAAMAEAQQLIVKKTAVDGVTIAIAAETLEVYFGEDQNCRDGARQ